MQNIAFLDSDRQIRDLVRMKACSAWNAAKGSDEIAIDFEEQFKWEASKVILRSHLANRSKPDDVMRWLVGEMGMSELRRLSGGRVVLPSNNVFRLIN